MSIAALVFSIIAVVIALSKKGQPGPQGPRGLKGEKGKDGEANELVLKNKRDIDRIDQSYVKAEKKGQTTTLTFDGEVIYTKKRKK